MTRRSIPFRERNPVPIGAAGLVVIALLLFVAFNAASLPLIGGGTAYSAAFTEAGGIKPDDDVRIAGVKVGKVTEVDLEKGHVRVDFVITEDAAFGPTTRAVVRMKTILGEKFVALEPAGDGQLDAGSQIPLARTVSSYDVVNAFQDLTTTTERIDTDALAESLTVLATEFKDSPEHVRSTLDGLSRLSRTVAGRDEQLGRLLDRAEGVTGLVASRTDQLETLIEDADLLMVELAKRREDIRTLFTNTSTLAQQLTGLVRDNREQLGPALRELRTTLTMLQKHDAALQRTISLMAPFTRVYANALGTGRWFDTWVSNLVVPVGAAGLAAPGSDLPDLVLPDLGPTTTGGGN
ncbi:MCE family protein [Intrasporangium calvum]|uniref:MCE family protein n=1 Tax=Intrasporangium calvum TaxID=53358 RepID=A0ABT5GK41_9MICO|nr:MlaD family protein [Intrasporangium calvum]MDC5698245.1 MCE family protein [Intrasporangium calvum]